MPERPPSPMLPSLIVARYAAKKARQSPSVAKKTAKKARQSPSVAKKKAKKTRKSPLAATKTAKKTARSGARDGVGAAIPSPEDASQLMRSSHKKH